METLVPRSAFWSHTGNILALNRTKAVWAFVLSNPGLHRLTFDCDSSPEKFATITTPNPSLHVYNLIPASESFLTSTFSTLNMIRHLNIGKHADNYLLINMGALLPTLESYVHSGQTGFDYKTLASSAPHSNLRSLAITKGSISRHHEGIHLSPSAPLHLSWCFQL